MNAIPTIQPSTFVHDRSLLQDARLDRTRKWFSSLFLAALSICVAVGAGGPPGGGSGGGGGAVTSVHVLTFNGWDHLSKGVNQVANDIKNTGADIVGMQECNGTDAAKLCSALGSGWNFVQDYVSGDYTIISRYPILKRIDATEDPYGGIGATIQLSPNQRVHVFNAHLNWTPYGPYQLVEGMSPTQVIQSENTVRMPGLNELLNMGAAHRAVAEPTFLVGDFNAPSHHDYYPLTDWPTSLACINAGMKDAYEEMHSNNIDKWAGQFLINDPGITWSPNGDPYGCYDRIDFVYYSSGDGIINRGSSEITVDTGDHRIVLATFDISLPVRISKASKALPASGGTGALRHPLLTWVPGSGAVSNKVYFGTSLTPPLAATTADSTWAPPLLTSNTKYYWRIDTMTSSGEVIGDTWNFTTRISGGVNPQKTVFAKNETIKVDFNGATTKTDWIGLYKKGTAYGWDSESLCWKYLSDTATAPPGTISSGTVNLCGQRNAGEYVIRFFKNDGYKLHDDVTIKVQ